MSDTAPIVIDWDWAPEPEQSLEEPDPIPALAEEIRATLTVIRGAVDYPDPVLLAAAAGRVEVLAGAVSILGMARVAAWSALTAVRRTAFRAGYARRVDDERAERRERRRTYQAKHAQSPLSLVPPPD